MSALPANEIEAVRIKTVAHWDAVFAGEEPGKISAEIRPEALNCALGWLCEGARSVLDFGCGNGVAAVKCALRGARGIVGVDLSAEAVRLSRRIAEANGIGDGIWLQGGVELLDGFPDASFDAALLMNILDNITPAEATRALFSVHRAVKPGGRVLVKLNAMIPAEKFAPWNIRVLDGDLLDDGLLLWNLPTARWDALLARSFSIDAYAEILYPEHETTNRLYRLVRP